MIDRSTPVAIVGMACRLPGADDLDAYWRLITERRSALTELPSDRLDPDYFDPRKGIPGKTYTRLGGIVRPRPLDPHLCPIPAEFSCAFEESVAIMLEVAATACRDANLDPFHMPAGRTGVFIGHARGSSLASDMMYTTRIGEIAQHLAEIEPFDGWNRELCDRAIERLTERVRGLNPCRNADGMPDVTGNAPARILSHALGLTGSYQVIDAACASGLFAFSAAARALRLGQMDAAIVGGASYSNWLSVVLFAQAQALSATGSFPFDARADGFVSTDGYGALVVKTLPQAERDGDRIYAVVTGIGTSSDGRGRSLWAPRAEGQIAAVKRAYGETIDPRSVQYIEAHGTSTQLGDATEIKGMTAVFGSHLAGMPKVPVSSVKGNIGHTVEAAGIAGLIKTVLAMRASAIPPSINFEHPNPEIHFDKVPFYVPTRVSEWAAPADGGPRRAGVNSFGIGGLNAHVVVEEYRSASSASVFLPSFTEDPPSEEIAVVGMGGIFPGARTVEAFRKLLESKTCAIAPVPPERWDSNLYYSEVPRAAFKASTCRGGFIAGFKYDWRRHTIPPKQVETADPLRYMLLDAADQALADSGYQEKPFDRSRTAVVVGSIIASDFFSDLSIGLRLPKLESDLRHALNECGLEDETTSEIVADFADRFRQSSSAVRDETGSFSSSTLASNLTRTFDLGGGAFVVDSGEASSLAALHAARNLLLSGDCDMVLCAGAQRHLSMDSYEWYGMRGLLASDTCSGCQGIIPGEAAGLLVLKRLSDARRNGDRIRAVINNVVLTLNKEASEEVPPTRALDGQASSLIGHTLGASGMVSVIEGILALDRQPFANGVAVNNRSIAGLTGQVILKPANVVETAQAEAAPVAEEKPEAHDAKPWRIVRLSATTLPALAARLERTRLEAVPVFETCGSSRFTASDTFRLAITCDSPDSLAQICPLAAKSILNPAARPLLEEQGVFLWDSRSKPRIAVMFPGQGSQYEGMLRELVEVSPAAAARQRELDRIMASLGLPTFAEMAWQPEVNLSQDVWSTQVSLLLADTIAFAALEEIGVRPDVVAGHSFGEYPALLAAGVWSAEQAIRCTDARCKLIVDKGCKGVLMATDAPPEAVTRLLPGIAGVVTIANCNAPDQTVVGGDDFAVTELGRRLAEEGFTNRPLPVPCPFHTPLMAPIKEGLTEVLRREDLRPCKIPLLSSVTNRYVADPLDIRDNLVAQLTIPVDYAGLVRRLTNDGINILIECGPRQVLSRLHRRILPPDAPVTVLSLDQSKRSAAEKLARITAALQCAGALLEEPGAQARSLASGVPNRTPNDQSILEPILHFDATERRRTSLRDQAATVPAQPADQSSQMSQDASIDEREAFLVNLICEHTGYPKEVVSLDADLEADLGIDSLKRAQIFGELREQFNIHIQSTGKLSLDDYPTLRHILEFLKHNAPQGHAAAAATSSASFMEPARTTEPGSAEGLGVSDSLEGRAGPERAPAPTLARPAAFPESSAVRETALREPAPFAMPATAPAPAPSGRIMSRFVLRTREAPLRGKPAEVVWSGAALVLGDNPIAEVLRARLTQTGVPVVGLVFQGSVENTVEELERIHRARPIHHVFLTQSCDSAAAEWLCPEDWQRRMDAGLMLPFALCQCWLRLIGQGTLPEYASLVSSSLLGGDFGFGGNLTAPEGGAMAGLLKSIRREFEGLTVKALDFAIGEPAPSVVTAIFSELAARTKEVEVAYVRGRRSVVRAIPRPVSPRVHDRHDPDGVWVVTGGARGVTAGVARELGLRFGLRLFLLGSTPLSAAAPEWVDLSAGALKELKRETLRPGDARGLERWSAIQKGIEVHRQLRQLAADRVDATYICCDVGDREALSQALQQVRQEAGPIRGIIHGAGIESACRYQSKQLAGVRSTIAVKAGAAASLMALTEADPLGWFIAFGSVNGRFGGLGQTDYSLASDMLPKLVRALRSRRPDCIAVNFDWPAWGEKGMSMRPESQLALESAGYVFMPQSEGFEHFLDEIRTRTPETEVIILDDARVIDLDRIMPPAPERAAWACLEARVEDSPLLEGITDLGGDRIAAEIRFDPVLDPFLSEHQYQGSGVLPSVVCLEALAETASLLARDRVTVLRDVQISRMFRFQSGLCQSAEVVAARSGADITVSMSSPLVNRSGGLIDAKRLVVACIAEEAGGEMQAPSLPPAPAAWRDMQYLLREQADRDNLVVHGPRFRGLQRFALEASEAWGKMTAPDEAEIGGCRSGSWSIPCVVLDSCMVVCAVHANQILGVRQLPESFERVHCRSLPTPGSAITVHARLRESRPDRTCYDFVLYSASGEPLLRVDGHWSTILSDREV